MIDLREQEQIGEDFMFFKRFQAPRRWTVEEASSMLAQHKAGELTIGQMLQPTTERNTSSETMKVRKMSYLNVADFVKFQISIQSGKSLQLT